MSILYVNNISCCAGFLTHNGDFLARKIVDKGTLSNIWFAKDGNVDAIFCYLEILVVFYHFYYLPMNLHNLLFCVIKKIVLYIILLLIKVNISFVLS